MGVRRPWSINNFIKKTEFFCSSDVSTRPKVMVFLIIIHDVNSGSGGGGGGGVKYPPLFTDTGKMRKKLTHEIRNNGWR